MPIESQNTPPPGPDTKNPGLGLQDRSAPALIGLGFFSTIGANVPSGEGKRVTSDEAYMYRLAGPLLILHSSVSKTIVFSKFGRAYKNIFFVERATGAKKKNMPKDRFAFRIF